MAVLLSAALGPSDNDAQSPSGRDFATVGGNLANHRYSSLTRINKSNLSKLGGAWSMHLEDGKTPGTMQATPVVVDGVMFIASGAGQHLRDRCRDWRIKWKHETTLGGTYRGVAVGEGKVFSGRRDNTLIALDQKTGARRVEDRSSQIRREVRPARPPFITTGLSTSESGGGEGGVRGQFGAYDARSREGSLEVLDAARPG